MQVAVDAAERAMTLGGLKPSAVVAALRCLPVRRARVLVLRYSDMAGAEIASVTGLWCDE